MTIVFLLFLLGDYIGHLINELKFPSPNYELYKVWQSGNEDEDKNVLKVDRH